MSAPAPPQGLPPPQRQVRSLRRTPQFIAVGVAALVAGTALYGLTHMGGSGGGSEKPVPAEDNGNADEVLKHMSTENQPVRRVAFEKPPLPQAQAETVQQTVPAPIVPDDMTETAIAARKAAWEAYFKTKADVLQARMDAHKVAMTSDIDPKATGGGSPAIDPSGVQTAVNAAAGMMPGGAAPKRDFFGSHESSPATDYLPNSLTDPISPFELKAGDIITAHLVSGMDSDTPGMAKAIVSKTVVDHATGLHILIPQGATLVGTYDTSIGYGQTRLITAWQRVIYPGPCDQSLDLGAMTGSDQTGQAGFEDITNNHLDKVFLNAILVSLFGAAVQLSQPPGSALQQYNPIQTGAGAVGQQMAQLGQQFAEKGLNIQPTQQIRQGYNFTVMVSKDIAFEKPWVEGVCNPIDVSVAR